MADHSRNQTRRRTGLVALVMVGALIGTAATSAPAAANDRLAEAIIGAALFYGLTYTQAPHFYDRGYYFDPQYYYFDNHRGHWRARDRHRRHARDHRRRDRRQYSNNRYRDDGPGYRGGRGYRNDHGDRGRDRRDRSRSRRDRDRDQDRRGRKRRGH